MPEDEYGWSQKKVWNNTFQFDKCSCIISKGDTGQSTLVGNYARFEGMGCYLELPIRHEVDDKQETLDNGSYQSPT